MNDRSAGRRLGQLMANEPELIGIPADEAGNLMIDRLASYIAADGFNAEAMIIRLERLKFETIMTGKTFAEVLNGYSE